jgi:hypothetical protein
MHVCGACSYCGICLGHNWHKEASGSSRQSAHAPKYAESGWDYDRWDAQPARARGLTSASTPPPHTHTTCARASRLARSTPSVASAAPRKGPPVPGGPKPSTMLAVRRKGTSSGVFSSLPCRHELCAQLLLNMLKPLSFTVATWHQPQLLHPQLSQVFQSLYHGSAHQMHALLLDCVQRCMANNDKQGLSLSCPCS